MSSEKNFPEEATPRKSWILLLFLLAPAALIMGIDRSILTITAPVMQTEFGLSLTELGLLISVFYWAYAAMQIPAGLLVQRFGTRATMMFAIFLWSAMTLATPLAGGFIALVATRSLLGIGQATDWPASIVGINRLFPDITRPAANAVLLGALYVGPVMGGPLTGYLIDPIGWRGIFFGCAAIGFIFLLFWWKFYHEDVAPLADPGMQKGASAVDAGVSGKVGATEFIRASGGLILVYFASGFLFTFYLSWIPTYLMKGRGIPVSWIGLFSGGIAASLCVGVFIGGKLLPVLRRRASSLRRAQAPAGAIALAIASICLVAQSAISGGSLLFFAGCIAAAALGVSQVVTWSTVQDIGGPRTAVITGAIMFSGNLAHGAGPLVSALVVERTGSWPLSLAVFGAVGMMGALAWIYINPDRRIGADSV